MQEHSDPALFPERINLPWESTLPATGGRKTFLSPKTEFKTRNLYTQILLRFLTNIQTCFFDLSIPHKFIVSFSKKYKSCFSWSLFRSPNYETSIYVKLILFLLLTCLLAIIRPAKRTQGEEPSPPHKSFLLIF